MIEKFWECPKYRYVKALQESMQDPLPYPETIPYKRFMGCQNCIGPIIGNNDMCCMICIDTDIIKTKKQRLKLANQIRQGIRKRESENKQYVRGGKI